MSTEAIPIMHSARVSAKSAPEGAAIPTSTSTPIPKASKLQGVCYDIRGSVLEMAHRMEEEGHRITKLNIGNPAAFGFEAPDEILRDVIHNLHEAQAYSDSRGLYAARKAVMQHFQTLGVADVDVDDVYLGNGVSELIMMAMQGFLEDGDEVLLPCPEYPLWGAVVRLCGGVPVHYRCDESAGWQPDLEDLRGRIGKRSRAIVVINPNNPTGAVYQPEILRGITELAEANGLVLFADEIYEKILYDDACHTPLARLAADTELLCVSFGGLSKNYRLAGFRSGWMVLSGNRQRARDYVEGLDILSAMRLCANVPAQLAVQTALGGRQSIQELVAPEGRLYRQREYAYRLLTELPGVSCVKPQGAIYLFPRLDRERFRLQDDERFTLDLLEREKILVVPGSAFNWNAQDHFRMVFLPHLEDLEDIFHRLGNFLANYHQ